MGEKILRYVKKDWNGLRCNWQRNSMAKVHTKLAVMRIKYKTDKAIASWEDSISDDEGHNAEDGENNLQNNASHFKGNKNINRYKAASKVQQQLQTALPVSILKHKDTYCSLTKRGEIVLLKHSVIVHSKLCELHYFEWDLSDQTHHDFEMPILCSFA
jgi:hypothetical protein